MQRRTALIAAAAAAAAPALLQARKAQAQEPVLKNIPALTSGWTDKFWTGPDGTKFHYCEAGRGVPVILIHGSGGTATNWMANGLGMAVAKTNKVYALEMRGHGQTVGPDGKRQNRTPNMDLDVLAFMDAMGIKRAHIGGFSMGGSITGQMLARAPERFITAHFGGSGLREEGDWAKVVPKDKEGTSPFDAKARELYNGRAAAEAAKAGVAATGTPQLSSQPVPAAVARPALDLSKVNFPILVVAGEYDTPYSKSHRLWREAPNFKRVILKERGHLSSYIAGMAPELYRDSLVELVTTNNSRA